MVSEFDVRLFGGPLLAVGGRPVKSPPGKALELLCRLVIAGHACRRDRLAEELWPGRATATAAPYLRQALWRLNTQMREGLGLGGGLDVVTVTGAGMLGLNPRVLATSDVSQFEAAHQLTRERSGPAWTAAQAAQVEEAVRTAREELLPSWSQDWCERERDRLRQALLIMLDELMAYCREHGLVARGVAHGRAALSVEPAREMTHRAVMQMLHEAGDRIGALRQFDRCAQALRQEFDLAPSAETTALYNRIRSGADAARGLSGAADAPRADPPVDGLSAIHERLVEIQDSLDKLNAVLASRG